MASFQTLDRMQEPVLQSTLYQICHQSFQRRRGARRHHGTSFHKDMGVFFEKSSGQNAPLGPRLETLHWDSPSPVIKLGIQTPRKKEKKIRYPSMRNTLQYIFGLI